MENCTRKRKRDQKKKKKKRKRDHSMLCGLAVNNTNIVRIMEALKFLLTPNYGIAALGGCVERRMY